MSHSARGSLKGPLSIAMDNGPFREPRAEWDIHRLGFLLPLARLATQGRQDLADRIVAILREWTSLARKGKTPAWESPMEAALRLVTLAAVAGLLRRLPIWQEWWDIDGRALVDFHARWLRYRIEDDSV